MPIPRLSPPEIVKLRHSHALNQTQFGVILGVSRRTVAAWEAGTWQPPVDLLDILLASDVEAATRTTKTAKITRETVKAYKKMRRDGISHASIVKLWHESSFTPTPEAQIAILEAFPGVEIMTASKLRAIMRLNKLSQKAVSEMFGISVGRVHNWVRDKTKIPDTIENGLRQRGYNVDDAKPSWIDEL